MLVDSQVYGAGSGLTASYGDFGDVLGRKRELNGLAFLRAQSNALKSCERTDGAFRVKLGNFFAGNSTRILNFDGDFIAGSFQIAIGERRVA
jgi:hypothetical protein